MNILRFIRKINNFCIWTSFIALLLMTMLMSAAFGTFIAFLFLTAGVFVLSSVYSIYACLSEITDLQHQMVEQMKVTNSLLSKLLEK